MSGARVSAAAETTIGAIPGSIVDLLHPSGAAPAVAVLGSACPEYLCDPRRRPAAAGPVDAVVFAPDARECRSAGWLENAADTMDLLLAANGIAYALTPRRWRRQAMRLLESRGFLAEAIYVHLAQGSSTHYVVPCDRASVKRLLPTLSAPRSAVLLANLVWSMPGAEAVVSRGWTSVGTLLRRPGARPALEWMSAVRPDAGRARRTLICCRSRGPSTHAVLSTCSDSGESTAVLKVPLTESAVVERRREAVMLSRLRGAASQAGAIVPGAVYRHGARPALQLDALTGESAVRVARAGRAGLATLVDRLGGWLEQWHVLTERPAPATAERLNREILQPARSLATQLQDGAAYVEWLKRCCDRIEGTPLPYVASHNDLTVSNVLCLQGRTRLGILDWEAAREDGLPLVDLFYAAASARRAASPSRRAAPALIEAFDHRSPLGRQVAEIAAGTSERLGLSVETVELLKHACAAQHAVDEQRRGRPGAQPFLQVLQWLILTRSLG